jgi:hypothetical protein
MFSDGQSTTWEDTWMPYTRDTLPETTYAALDFKNSRAQMIGRGGAGTVVLIAGSEALHFVELTPTGNQTVTTVFLGTSKRGSYPAIHSRHMNLIGQPSVSQFRGYCAPRF